MHHTPDRRSTYDFFPHAQDFHASSLGVKRTPHCSEDPRLRAGNRRKALAVMSLAGSQGGAGEFDLAKLEAYSASQLKGFCKGMGLPTQGASRKEEYQNALRAWVEARSQEDVDVEGSEDDSSEDLPIAVMGVTPLDVCPLLNQGAVCSATA
ncbi:hypothetical protein NDU88_005854 [Pleurodeles waltl]|uniref:Uncharacterized protein n=1 Tax=Pleurodeles waltl TaxID=8319 RepID=A0AAV7WC83_PLEWA|nr:hypothetical protein NDU88_005854 [Pleurodeles waltl]